MPLIQFLIGKERRTFETPAGVTLLDEALKAGLAVNYSCRRGDCGQCAASLVEGEVQIQDITYASKSGNDILLCNSTPISDVSLRIAHYPELDEIQVLRSPAKIQALNRLSEGVIELVLRLPPSQNFRYLPGQFIRLTNKERITRSYSLASIPGDNRMLRMHVRQVDDGDFSRYLFESAREGDLLYLEGPQGHFFVRDEDRADSTIFLATGTGIAPVLAILRGLTDSGRAALGAISVYWGNRFKEDEYLRDGLRELSERMSFDYYPVFSRDNGTAERYVQDVMKSHHYDLSRALVFACGNPGMIESSRVLCATLGLPPGNFRGDKFTAS